MKIDKAITTEKNHRSILLKKHEKQKLKRIYSKAIGAIVRLASLAIATTLSAFPLVWMFLTSIKHRVDAFAKPPVFIFNPTFEAYETILGQERFINMLQNSIIVTIISTILTLTAAATASYAVAFLYFRFKASFMVGVLSTRLLPPVVLVVPLFFLIIAFISFFSSFSSITSYLE